MGVVYFKKPNILGQFPFIALGGWDASDSSTVVSSYGLLGAGFATSDASSSLGTSTDGAYVEQTSGAVAGNDAFVGNTNPFVTFNKRIEFLARFALVDTVDIRMGIGLSSSFNRIIGFDDAAANHMIGLQFSPATRSDVNFQFMNKDGTTQKLTNSGVVGNNSLYTFRFVYTPSTSILYELYNSSGARISSAVVVDNLPSTAQSAQVQCGLETTTTAGKSIRQYCGYLIMGGRS